MLPFFLLFHKFGTITTTWYCQTIFPDSDKFFRCYCKTACFFFPLSSTASENVVCQWQVKRKKAAHAGMFDIAKTPNRPMIHIGG